MSARYTRWAANVVAEVSAFRRDHEDRHYLRIRELFDALPPVDDLDPHEQLLQYTGWTDRVSHVSARALERLNPGYRVRVVRTRRPGTGRRGRLLPLGYVVTARGPVELPPFVFRVGPGRTPAFRPMWSNSDAEFSFRRLEPAPPEAEPVEVVHGYLDAILHRTPADERPETWLPALVMQHPSEVHDFVVSPHGEPFRERAAAAGRLFPTNDRWGDRFALAAFGLAEPARSDLLLLEVARPNPPRDDAPGAMRTPLLETRGRLVEVAGYGRPLPMPSMTWNRLRDVSLQEGGTVTTRQRFIRYEATADPIHDFVAGQWRTALGSPPHPEGVLLRRLPEVAETIPEAILIGGRSDANWFHWMAEYLPRVLSIPSSIGDDVPLLLSPRVPQTGIEALRELSSRPLVFADPETSQHVGVLHVAAPPLQVLDTTRVPWAEGLGVNRAPFDNLRRIWGVDRPRSGTGLRLFLERRAAHRGIANQAALNAIALRHGFTAIDPSRLSFAEQRELFSQADVVVGASGAVMANYLMLRPGSRILALTSDHLHDFLLPVLLAEIAGAEFRYLLGPARLELDDAADRNHWVHADFDIRPADLDRALGLYP